MEDALWVAVAEALRDFLRESTAKPEQLIPLPELVLAEWGALPN